MPVFFFLKHCKEVHIGLCCPPEGDSFDSGSLCCDSSSAQRALPNACRTNLIWKTSISSLYLIVNSFDGARRMDNGPLAFNLHGVGHGRGIELLFISFFVHIMKCLLW
jgi:hypothetical protein